MMRFSVVFLFLLGFFSQVGLGKTPDGTVFKRSENSYSVTVDRVRAAIRAKGLNLFREVDHAGGASGVGISLRPSRVFIFGNPKMGGRLMKANPAIALALPLKMAVYEDMEGKVWVSFRKPELLLREYGLSHLKKIEEKMTCALVSISLSGVAEK